MSDDVDAPVSEPLRVALLADGHCFDLFPSVIRRLCVGLIDEAVRVVLICDEAELPPSFPAGPVRRVTYTNRWWTSGRRRAVEVIRQIGADQPMLVHALSGRLLGLAKRLAAAWQVPMVIQIAALGELRERQAGGASSVHFIAPSEPLLDYVRDASGCPPQQCVLIRPGLHCQSDTACLRDPSKMPAIMAPMVAEGSLSQLVRAIGAVLAAGHESMLFVLGTGAAEGELRRLIAQLDLVQSVTFAGRLREPMAAVRGGDLFVLPAKVGEMMELPLAAMGAGLAMVAASGSVLDFLAHERTALLYPERDQAGLAEQLTRLLADPPFARRLAAQGQAYVREHHTVSAMVRATRQLYDRIALPQRTIRIKPSR
jgi:hypothetical protein